MINGRLWTIVNPTVGVPVFFIFLVLASVFIHLHVILGVDWYYEWVSTGAMPAAAAAGGGG
jgi:light-harvesting protein B-800-850 alpha chain